MHNGSTYSLYHTCAIKNIKNQLFIGDIEPSIIEGKIDVAFLYTLRYRNNSILFDIIYCYF